MIYAAAAPCVTSLFIFNLQYWHTFSLIKCSIRCGLFEKTIMAGIVAKKKKPPAVLNHFEVPEVLPDGDFKAKCKYCDKEITGSTKTTTNWWKHLVRNKNKLGHFKIPLYHYRDELIQVC